MSIVDFAGIEVDNITLEGAVSKVKEFVASGKPHLIVTPNPEIIVASQKYPELKEIINSADLRVPDGISMVVVSRMLKNPLKERVSGIDLMLQICKETNFKIYLLGGEPGVAVEAAGKLTKKCPGLNVVGNTDGYFIDDQKVIKGIRDTKPDILFVGLGAGRQERWIKKHLQGLNVPVCMVIGGSLDVISGRKKRAPKWTRKLYIEWLYRLVSEPKRWKRQLALPKFLYLTLFKKVV
ncbi:MAG: WecB/TagA/CpsF family glycosyltransferase [Candidatus Margulisiibacteriota bacterium]|nr:WecB/TagA/CpsF family glycosyltransferase [Candidatus Margulisiibacteriota bacterium]